MPDSAIGELPHAEYIDDNDLIPLEQGGETMHITGEQLKAFIDRNILGIRVQTLPVGEDVTGSYNAETGILTLGIPRSLGAANSVDGVSADTSGDVPLCAVSYDRGQSLTAAQKARARSNIGAAASVDGVAVGAGGDVALGALSYARSQSLTDAQKTAARGNLGLETKTSDEVSVTVNNYSVPYNILRRKGSAVMMSLGINITAEITQGTWVQIGTVPAGFRPIVLINTTGMFNQNNQYCQVRIGASGEIEIQSYNANPAGQMIIFRVYASWIAD